MKEVSQVLDKLMELATPEEVLAMRPTPELDARIRALLKKNREESLTPEEELEWEGYETLEHLVRMAKISAKKKLRAQ